MCIFAIHIFIYKSYQETNITITEHKNGPTIIQKSRQLLSLNRFENPYIEGAGAYQSKETNTLKFCFTNSPQGETAQLSSTYANNFFLK